MAVDTKEKRFSALSFHAATRGIHTFPSGTIGQAQRQSLAYLYSGILASAPVAVVSNVIVGLKIIGNLIIDNQIDDNTIGNA